MKKTKRKAGVFLLIALLLMGVISTPVSAISYPEYQLTYIAGTGGSISGETSQTVSWGENGTAVLAVADDGYHFVKWSDDSTDNPRTDVNVIGDVSVTAEFAINVLTLTADKDKVTEGEGVTFTTNAPGNNLAAFFLDGVWWGNGTIETTPNPFPWSLIGEGSGSNVVATYRIYDFDSSAGITITWETPFLKEVNVLFMRDTSVPPTQYTLTYVAGENGSLIGTTPQTVSCGTSGSAITVVPDVGYRFVKWSDDSTDNPRIDENVTGDISVTAQFEQETYIIEPISDITITGYEGALPNIVVRNSKNEIVTDLSPVFTCEELGANFRYSLSDRYFELSEGTAEGNYLISVSLDSLHADPVSFQLTLDFPALILDPDMVEVVKGSSYVISLPELPDTVGIADSNIQDSNVVEFDPEKNILSLAEDTPLGEYYITYVDNDNSAIRSNFIIIIRNPKLTYDVGEHGIITGKGSQLIEYGNDGTAVTAIADDGYHFNGWSDGVTTAERTDVNVTGDITVTANFAVNTYIVGFEANGGSTINTQTVENGHVATAPTIPTRSGYTFQGWYQDSALTTLWDFEMHSITEDTTIYAKWSKNASNNGSSSSDRNKDTNATDDQVIVVVNGEEEKAGTETKSEENGQTIVKVEVNSEAIESKIEQVIENQEDSKKNNIGVPIADTTSDAASVLLTGAIVKKLEDNDFTLTVSKNDIQYNIPAKEMAIEAVAEKLNVEQSSLKDIEVDVQISRVSDEVMQKYDALVTQNHNELIVPPVEFNIVAKTTKYDGTEDSVTISRFSNYVERVIAIPMDLDSSKITTGIVFNADGTYSHVPTEVFQENGIWYARLNSLTNSDYSVIWNPITVSSVENHWSREIVNDMASRLVISNVETFNPDASITRGELAEYMTKALGIYRTGVAKADLFNDVNQTDTLADAITIASDYGIINGYADGTFRAEAMITRQEAMTMYAKAMDIVELESIDENRIDNYSDQDQVADWAYESVKKVLASGVFNGTSETTISPRSTLKYAEAATAISNLLIESGLINK